MDAAFLADWLNLMLRWAHMIVGIAWIGASFYFIWLDNHLHPPLDPADAASGIGGEVWAVHGGGFYTAKKFKVAPREAAARAALVHVGSLHHADHRLPAALPRLLPRRRGRADRPDGDGARQVGGDRHQPRLPGRRLAVLRLALPLGLRPGRSRAGRAVSRSIARSPPGRSATSSPAAAPTCISAPCSASSWC